MVNPTVVEASPTTHPGLDGALPFPRIHPKELSCTAGTLAYGDGA